MHFITFFNERSERKAKALRRIILFSRADFKFIAKYFIRAVGAFFGKRRSPSNRQTKSSRTAALCPGPPIPAS
jgi:hypothetical protein